MPVIPFEFCKLLKGDIDILSHFPRSHHNTTIIIINTISTVTTTTKSKLEEMASLTFSHFEIVAMLGELT